MKSIVSDFPLTKVSSFAIQKGFVGKLGTVRDVNNETWTNTGRMSEKSSN